MGTEQDLKFNVYSAISRAIINKHKFPTSQVVHACISLLVSDFKVVALKGAVLFVKT